MMPGWGWPSCAPRGHWGGQRCPLRRPIVGVRIVSARVASATRAGRARVGRGPLLQDGGSWGHRRLWNRQEVRRLPGALCWKGIHPHKRWLCPRGPLPVPGVRGLSQRRAVGTSQAPENSFFSLWTQEAAGLKTKCQSVGSARKDTQERRDAAAEARARIFTGS